MSGLEISSVVMTFALYELSINPEYQDRLREELIAILRKYNDEICYDSLVELEFMQQVIDGNIFYFIIDRFKVYLTTYMNKNIKTSLKVGLKYYNVKKHKYMTYKCKLDQKLGFFENMRL